MIDFTGKKRPLLAFRYFQVPVLGLYWYPVGTASEWLNKRKRGKAGSMLT